jgi:hypothetical protein
LANLQIDADPDLALNPAYHFDSDPDPYFYLKRIRIWILFDADPGADPGYHSNADPDPQHWSTVFAAIQHTARMNKHTQTKKRL